MSDDSFQPQIPVPTITALSVLSALVTHQLFRRYETLDLLVHAAFLIGPPALITALILTPLTLEHDKVRWVFTSVLGTHLVTLALSVVVYRLSPWHPLAGYPGPWWAKVSMFGPTFAFAGSRSKRVRAMHDRYGDVVRLGPNELSFRVTAAIPSITGPYGIPKGTDWAGSMMRDHNLPLIALRNTEEHLYRRRPWNRGLGPAALRTYHPVIVNRAQLLLSRLEQRLEAAAGGVDLGEWFDRFSYDFMSDMAFGGGSELLRDGDGGHVWGMIEIGMACVLLVSPSRRVVVTLRPQRGIPSQPYSLARHVHRAHPRAARPVRALMAHSERLAKLRLQRGSTSPDLFHYLVSCPCMHPCAQFGFHALKSRTEQRRPAGHAAASPAPAVGVLAIVAGADTVSTALTSVFQCLLTHPQSFARLRDEVARFYPEGEDPFSVRHHPAMHYLNAVINEALRLFPPVASGGSRRVPDDAAPVHIYGSVYAPAGTVVRLPTWTIQRDARHFSFPDAFWPERWLVAAGLAALADLPLPLPPGLPADNRNTNSDNNNNNHHNNNNKATNAKDDAGASWFVHDEHAFLAFSHGPMNCPGKALALLEMRMLVVALVQRFGARMRLKEDRDAGSYEREIRDYFTASRPCVPIVLG